MTDEDPKKPGALARFSAYVKKNQAAEAERRKRTGEPSFGEELSNLGSDWGKNLTKGMAQVGMEEERKLSGKTGSIGDTDDEYATDVLFGGSSKKKPAQNCETNGGARAANDVYTDAKFISKLCDFLRYVNEDDDVELYQQRGSQFTKVDYKYLSKLLTRYSGTKVTLKERDLSIK